MRISRPPKQDQAITITIQEMPFKPCTPLSLGDYISALFFSCAFREKSLNLHAHTAEGATVSSENLLTKTPKV